MPAPVAAASAPVTPSTAPAAAKPVVPTPAAPVEAEPTFEVTVDGKPTKLTRKQIERYAGKGAFADRTVSQTKEALRAIKQREAELAERESIWDDDEKLEAELERRGKLDKLAKTRLQKKLAEQEMTPEQRERDEAKREAAELKKKLEAADQEKAQAAQRQLETRLQAHVDNTLDSAWERAGFERNADNLEAARDVMAEWLGLGLLPPTIDGFTPGLADRIVEAAQEKADGAFQRLESRATKNLKGAALKKRLGEAVWKEVLRHAAEEFRSGGMKKPAAAPVAKAAPPGEWISPQDALKKMRGLG